VAKRTVEVMELSKVKEAVKAKELVKGTDQRNRSKELIKGTVKETG